MPLKYKQKVTSKVTKGYGSLYNKTHILLWIKLNINKIETLPKIKRARDVIVNMKATVDTE